MKPDENNQPVNGDKARKRRNRALFGLLLAFVALVYAVTIVKMQSGH